MKKTIITLLALAGAAMGAEPSLENAVYSSVGQVNETTTLSGQGSSSFTLTYTLNVRSLDNIKLTGATTAEFKNYSLVSLSGGAGIHVGTALGYSSIMLDDAGNKVNENGTRYVRAWGVFQDAVAATTGGTHSGSYYGGNNLIEAGTNDATTFEEMAQADDLSSIANIVVTQVHTNTSKSELFTTLFYTDGTTKQFEASNTDLKWSDGFGNWSSLGVNTDLVSSVYLFSGVVTKEDAQTLNALAAAAVPEPTTATLSLLALAGLAARRRRR